MRAGREEAGGSGARLRALVVDDEPPLVQVVSGYLTREGFEVVTAIDGESAVATARKSDPDVVVLDLMLPGLGTEPVEDAPERLGLVLLPRLHAERQVAHLRPVGPGREAADHPAP